MCHIFSHILSYLISYLISYIITYKISKPANSDSQTVYPICQLPLQPLSHKQAQPSSKTACQPAGEIANTSEPSKYAFSLTKRAKHRIVGDPAYHPMSPRRGGERGLSCQGGPLSSLTF